MMMRSCSLHNPRQPLLRTSHLLKPGGRRLLSSKPPSNPEVNASTASHSSVDRVISRLPRFLQGYANPLRRAPITHVTAFLILHEITAIAPIFGLAAAFHYGQWLPPLIGEGKWVSEGVEKFGRWFRKKGWLGEEGAGREKWWGRGEGSVKIVVELATAYAVTKALLPLRLIFSVWATPWFARVFVTPTASLIGRLFSRGGSKATTSSVAGTGATGGAAIGKAAEKSSATPGKIKMKSNVTKPP